MRIAFIVLITFLHFTSMIDYQEAAKVDPVHLIMTKEERMTAFGTDDQIPEYYLVQPVQLAKDRHRRHLNLESSNADLMLSLSTDDDEFILHLYNRSNIVKTPLKVAVRDVHQVDTHYMLEHPNCLYHGKVNDMDDSAVAISTCNPHEMAGLVQLSAEERYVLAPLPKRIRRAISYANELENGTSHHVLYKQRSKQREFCGSSEQSSFQESETYERRTISAAWNHKIKRQAMSDYTVELAIFVDDVLYSQIAKQHPTDPTKAILNLICTYINAVQLIYEQPSLSVSIGFEIVGVTIIKESEAGPAKGPGDMVDYLKSFSYWQKKLNPIGDHNDEHWDHAIILTGLDLYTGPLKSDLVGMSYVKGMCDPAASVSICEAKHLDTVFILSHEIGHNLGMDHDGKGNTCEENDYLMSPSTGPGKTTWSECSDQFLVKFLKNYGRCLLDEAYIVNELDHRSNLLPGEKYDISTQCFISKGSDATPALSNKTPFNNVCRELWCKVGMTIWFAHPALDGTQCDESKICFHGDCVEKSDVMDYLKERNLVLDE